VVVTVPVTGAKPATRSARRNAPSFRQDRRNPEAGPAPV